MVKYMSDLREGFSRYKVKKGDFADTLLIMIAVCGALSNVLPAESGDRGVHFYRRKRYGPSIKREDRTVH